MEANGRVSASLLHACMRANDLASLQLLLESHLGCPSQRSVLGTLLHVAVWCDNESACRLLLNAGADPLFAESSNPQYSALQRAVSLGRQSICHLFWDNASTDRRNLRDLHSLLLLAATYGHASIVGDCLDQWKDSMKRKESALLMAVERWHYGVVALLLEKVRFAKGVLDKALHHAIDFKRPLLTGHTVRYSELDYGNQSLIVGQLIDAGADPNGRQHGKRPLHSSVGKAPMTGVLITLLRKGANAEWKNNRGQTPLHFHALSTSPGPTEQDDQIQKVCVKLLVAHGACLTTSDADGETPLHAAAYKVRFPVFQLYASFAPDRDMILGLKNAHDESVLHYAAIGGKVDTLQALLATSSYVDINAPNHKRWTPLLCALAPCEGKTVFEAIAAARLLLNHGAYSTSASMEGWTPLHCLSLYSDPHDTVGASDLGSELIKLGADIEAEAEDLDESSLSTWTGVRRQQFFGNKPQNMAVPPAWVCTTSEGSSPLRLAVENQAVGVLKSLMDSGSKGDARVFRKLRLECSTMRRHRDGGWQFSGRGRGLGRGRGWGS